MAATAIPLDPAVGMAQDFQNLPANQGINPMAEPPAAAAGQAQTRQILEQMRSTMPPNEWQQFVADMQAKSPEERAMAITQLATNFTLEGQDAQTDMTRADALRQDAPQGRTFRDGIYQAASPLEHIAQVMNNQRREKEYGTARDARGGARAGQTGAIEGAMSRALRTQ